MWSTQSKTLSQWSISRYFSGLACFLHDPTNVDNLISGSSVFSKPACTSGSSQFTYCWSLAWRILSISLLASKWAQLCSSLKIFGIAFLWDWNENWPFPVLWPLPSFPNLLAYWVQHFHSISFRFWNSSTGIPLPPLALFVVMFPKSHLTSCSRMSGSRWLITPLWLSESLRPFLYSSSVYSCHLFLISSDSVRSVQFLSYIVPLFAWNAPLVSLIFFKRSLALPILLFSSISVWCLLKAFLPLLAFLWNSAFSWVYFAFCFFALLPFASLLFSAICKTIILPCCISFSSAWFWSPPPVQCYKPLSIILQTLYQT